MISIIVPAHNEAFEIGHTLTSILDAAKALGRPFEVIVVNDASTDATAQVAQEAGVRVLEVGIRKISAVRNAGARAAQGEILFFVDADTRISEGVLRGALLALERGAVGGGAWVNFSEPMGWVICLGIRLFTLVYMRLLGWAAGCFVFSRKDAFWRVGGFDETLYASEEIALSRALKKQGRFVLVHAPVMTSGRKMRMYSPLMIFPLIWNLLRYGPAFLRQRRGLQWWYEGKREKTRS